MKKGTYPILIAALLLAAWGLTRYFNWVAIYRIATASMEPNFRPEEKVYGTALKKPDYLSVVAYRALSLPGPQQGPPTEQTCIGRIVAKGGDVLQLINGRAQVNGRIVDQDILIKRLFALTPGQAQENRALLQTLKPDDLLDQPGQSAVLAFLDDRQYEQCPSPRPEAFDPPIGNLLQGTPAEAWVAPDWTINNYGPITIPAGHFFILGDNRSNSEDSRHRGPIPEDAVIATLF